MRRERNFEAEAKHHSSQRAAGGLGKTTDRARNILDILGNREPARGRAGLAINQRAIDRDTGARREVGAPAVTTGDFLRTERVRRVKTMLQAGRRLALKAKDDCAGLIVTTKLTANDAIGPVHVGIK